MAVTNYDFLGNDLKFIIEPESFGFDKDEDEFEVTISRGSAHERTFKKEELVRDDEGNYYVCFNTEDFGTGKYMITVTAHIPDEDFDDGYRDEITQLELINIKKPRK